jgi:ribosome-associated translation inhibitor RaiA
MNLLQITFHNVQTSPAVVTRIRASAAKLERYYKPITSCRVVIEPVQRHQKHGLPYSVHLELHLPGKKVIVRRQPGRRPAPASDGTSETGKHLEPNSRHKDLYVALHDAFDVARRRLEEIARKQRTNLKGFDAKGLVAA